MNEGSIICPFPGLARSRWIVQSRC